MASAEEVRREEVDGVEEGSGKGPEERERTQKTREGQQEQTHSRQAEEGRMKEWSTKRWCEKTGSGGGVEERRKWSGRRGGRTYETMVETGIQ